MGVNCLCFDTLRTEEGYLSKDRFPSFQFKRTGQIKKTKCLAAKNTFVSKNNKPVRCFLLKTGTGLLAVEGFRKNLKMAKCYKHVKSLPVEKIRKNLEMVKDSRSPIRPQKREGLKI